MTNAEIIAKIRAEIERLNKAYPHWMVKYAMSELLSSLSDLEKSMPAKVKGSEELENELVRFYLKDLCASEDDELTDATRHHHFPIMWDDLRDIAEHFYDLGCRRTAEKYDEIEYNRQRAEESVPVDLEEAAMNYIAPIENEDGLKVINFSGQDIKDAFIAGAKWQENHTPLPEDAVLFQKGVEEGKRLMMEEAVEATVEDWNPDPRPEITIPLNPEEFNAGDKVRIIIVKED